MAFTLTFQLQPNLLWHVHQEAFCKSWTSVKNSDSSHMEETQQTLPVFQCKDHSSIATTAIGQYVACQGHERERRELRGIAI